MEIINEKVCIGDAELRGAMTATLVSANSVTTVRVVRPSERVMSATNTVDAGGETISRGDIVIYEDDEADFMGKAQNAIAANFSARAKQSGSNAVRNLEEAHKYLDDVVNELMKSDDPNDAKLVEPVKKLRKDVNAVLWKAMSIR